MGKAAAINLSAYVMGGAKGGVCNVFVHLEVFLGRFFSVYTHQVWENDFSHMPSPLIKSMNLEGRSFRYEHERLRLVS